jgi:hypothetical protein
LLTVFGAESLVAASDYPLFEKDRYAQYMELANNWIVSSHPRECRFERSLFGERLADRKG